MDHTTSDGPGRKPGDPEARADVEDLRATEESIRIDLGRLTTVEAEKRALEAGDPRTDRLSDEAIELAARISQQTRAERELTDKIG